MRQGEGIGLALVQDLAKLHGGKIDVQSRRGEGSTFSMRIPLGAWHLPAELVERLPKPSAKIPSAALASASALQYAGAGALPPAPAAGGNEGAPESFETADARILVVDDNADLRNYLVRLLGRSFKNIEAAPDGQTALELARENPPDLILTDIMMPGLDGLGLIRELRADARTRQVPIILLSARVGEEPTVEGLRAGADDYLTKPFSGRELLARVTVHLRMAVVRRAAAEHRAKEQALRRLLAEKDEFLTIASHEFRTPLTTIGLQADGLLRLLSGPLVPEEVASRLRRRVEMVRSSCRRLEEIIERLLDVLAMNDGNPFKEVEPVDVAEVARQVVGRFQQNRQAGPVLSLTTDGPSIGRYDKRAIEQILSNLLSNAIKFGEGNPVDVSVRSEPSLVRIIVQDRGKGIDPKDQERIFDRFGRAVSRNDYGGFGLGLWMVRRLAEALNGVARVESSPGMGSTFTIELPRG
jgi:signal transduction histidine kinase